MKNKECLIAEILAELYEMGRWRVKGGVIHVETTSVGGTLQDKQASNGEYGNSSDNGNHKRRITKRFLKAGG